jgi:hypothetical protein
MRRAAHAAAGGASAVRRIRDRAAYRGPGATSAAAGRLDRYPAGQGQLRPGPPSADGSRRRTARAGGAGARRVRSGWGRHHHRDQRSPARIAAARGTGTGGELDFRRLLIHQDGETSEIITWWFPSGLTEGTALADPAPLRGGVRQFLARTSGLRIDHVIEHITARRALTHEAKLLGISRTAPLLAMYITAGRLRPPRRRPRPGHARQNARTQGRVLRQLEPSPIGPEDQQQHKDDQGSVPEAALTWCNKLERVTRIELALSAWEAARLWPLRPLTWRFPWSRVTVTDP